MYIVLYQFAQIMYNINTYNITLICNLIAHNAIVYTYTMNCL